MNSLGPISVFWMIAALLLFMALAFILPPLLRKRQAVKETGRSEINIAVYRDQLKELETDRISGVLPEDQYQSAKHEIKGRLAEDALAQESANIAVAADGRKLGYALGLFLPVAAIGLYFWLGNPDAMNLGKPDPSGNLAMMGKHDIMKMVQQAEKKVQANPQDAETWSMLARSYAAMQRWPEAWKSYQFASKLRPDDAGLLAGQAEALAVLKGGALEGESMSLVDKALQIDPANSKALELAAAYAFQRKNFSQAAEILERLHKQLAPDDPFAREVMAALTQARQMEQAGSQIRQAAPALPAPTAGATIRGTIEIAAAIQSKINSRDVIFMFARPVLGGPPVAVVRGPAASFPMDFELSDRWSMNPNNLLSMHKQVIVVARISKSGAPMGQPGDLEGSIKDVQVGAQGVKLVIDKVLP